MQTNYIVRLKSDRLFCFYHTEESGILYKTYDKYRWSKAKLVLPDAMENFSAVISREGRLYLFCQERGGDVILCVYENDSWSNKTILQNQSRSIYSVLFNAIITDKGLSLIYNTPAPDGGFYLMYQQLNQNGQWSQAIRIDKCVQFNNALYQVQAVSGDHLLVFYQTRAAETNIGYREFTPERYTDYQIFCNAGINPSDTCFLTTDSAIHTAYIIRGMFGSQLVYRKKDGASFSPPLLIYEGQKLNDLLLFIVRGTLYITFRLGEQLYYCTSQDGGASFSKAAKYRNKFCLQPVKSLYISQEKQDEGRYFIREVYTDSLNPCDIQLMPDLYEDFFPAEAEQPKPAENAPLNAFVRPAEEPESIGILKNHIMTLEKQLDEKGNQILYLTNQLKAKNEEVLRIDAERKMSQKRFNNERDELTRMLDALSKRKDEDEKSENGASD